MPFVYNVGQMFCQSVGDGTATMADVIATVLKLCLADVMPSVVDRMAILPDVIATYGELLGRGYGSLWQME